MMAVIIKEEVQAHFQAVAAPRCGPCSMARATVLTLRRVTRRTARSTDGPTCPICHARSLKNKETRILDAMTPEKLAEAKRLGWI